MLHVTLQKDQRHFSAKKSIIMAKLKVDPLRRILDIGYHGSQCQTLADIQLIFPQFLLWASNRLRSLGKVILKLFESGLLSKCGFMTSPFMASLGKIGASMENFTPE